MSRKSKKSKKRRDFETTGAFVNGSGQVFGDREEFLLNARLNLIDNPESFPDVQVFCADQPLKPIAVHRCILASRSPVFRQLFQESRYKSGKGLFPGVAVKVCLEYEYETVMAMLDFMYANTVQVKLKHLAPLVELSLCYGLQELTDLCLAYAGIKLEKLQNSSDPETNKAPATEIHAPQIRHKSSPNPLYLIQTAVSAIKLDFLKTLMDKIPQYIRTEHFESSHVLTQLTSEALKILLSSDKLKIDEYDLARIYASWYVLHGQGSIDENSKSHGSNSKSSLPVTAIRFFLLSRDEIAALEQSYEHCFPKDTLSKARALHDEIDSGALNEEVLRKRAGTRDRDHFVKLKFAD